MGILDLAFPWNMLATIAALLLIGTFLFKMVTKKWWWETLKK
jgi:hypothetical protein